MNATATQHAQKSPATDGKQPWLSVIMPTYNGGVWLEEAFQSLVDQDDRDFECVVVDGSEGTLSSDIVARFQDKLTIRLFSEQSLPTWIEKTNFGVKQARATHFSMLHQDDVWLPGRAAWLRKRLAAHPEGVMHLHPSRVIDAEGRRLGVWRCPLPSQEAAIPHDTMVERLMVQNFISVPSPAIRCDAFLRVGGLDSSLWYTADWDLYLRLALDGAVYYQSKPLSAFRIHGSSLTMSGSRSLDDFRGQMVTVLNRYIDQLSPQSRARVLRATQTSIDVNTALASAKNGDKSYLLGALRSVLALGPMGMARYFSYSRLAERVFPRLRARFVGNL